MDENNLLDIDLIRAVIKKKYGSLKSYAEKLGISEQNLNGKLERLSKKFLSQLKLDNIYIDGYVYQNFTDNQNGVADMKGNYNNVNGNIKEVNDVTSSKVLLQFIKDQREDIHYYRNIVQQTIPMVLNELKTLNNLLIDLIKKVNNITNS